MVHRMKTPMTNILWEAEQLKTGLENMKYRGAARDDQKTPDSLIGELKELKLMNRYLMKFLQIQSPKFKTTDLNPLLREVAETYSRHLQGRIRFDLILDRNIPALKSMKSRSPKFSSTSSKTPSMPCPRAANWRSAAAGSQKTPGGPRSSSRTTARALTKTSSSMIFTPNYTTKQEGFGIGLPVCQRIVAAHGGTIVVESQVGIGTRIAIFIPGGTPAHGQK